MALAAHHLKYDIPIFSLLLFVHMTPYKLWRTAGQAETRYCALYISMFIPAS